MNDTMANLTNSSAVNPAASPTILPTMNPSILMEPPCKVQEQESTFLLGVILGLLGSIAINTGNNIQSLGMNQLEEKKRKEVEEAGGVFDPTEKIEPSQSKVWIFGTTVFLSGSLLNFWSYGFAPQSVLAALESIQFVTNILFGKFMLGETISGRMYVGTVLCIAGTVLVVVVMAAIAKADSEPPTSSELIELYDNSAYIGYLVVIVIGGVLIQMTHLHYQKKMNEDTPLPHSHLVLPITYAVFSALFGTLSVVFAKCLAILLERHTKSCECLKRECMYEDFFAYVCLVAWICLVGVWLFRLNEALSKYNPLFIIPLLQVNFIFFAMISGGIYFNEFDEVFFGAANSGDENDNAVLDDESTSVPTPTPAPTPGNPLKLPFDIPGPPVAGYVVGCLVMFSGLFLLRPEVSGSATVAPMEEGPTGPKDEESPPVASNRLEGQVSSRSDTASSRSRRASELAERALDGAAKSAEKVLEIAHAGSIANQTPRKERTPRVDSADKAKGSGRTGAVASARFKVPTDSKASVDSSPGFKAHSSAEGWQSKAEAKEQTADGGGLDSIPASPAAARPDEKLAPSASSVAEAKAATPSRKGSKSAKAKKFSEPSPAKKSRKSR